MYFYECVVERRARTDQRWIEDVGAGGGKHGSNAMVRRSLDVDQRVGVESDERKQHDNNSEEECHVGRSGEVWRRGVLGDQPPPENPVRRV
jgi:hypothetical protein